MGAKKTISVFGIELESLQMLLNLVGYKSRTSIHNINKQHGSLELFVKKRLNAKDDQEAKELLMLAMQPKAAQRHKDELVEHLIALAITDFIFKDDVDMVINNVRGRLGDYRSISEIKKDMLTYL